MERTNLPADIEVEISGMLIDVPGVGRVPLGEMTVDHHRRHHDEIAREVGARLSRFISDTEECVIS